MKSRRRAFLAMLAAGGASGPWLRADPVRPKRIAFFTDIHARTEWETPAGMLLAAEKIRAAKPDLVICGGDCITDGFTTPAAELGPRWAAFRDMLDALGTGVIPCLGNHDVTGVAPPDGTAPDQDPRRAFRDFFQRERTYHVTDALGLRVITLDSLALAGADPAAKERYRGFVPPEQMDWLRKTVADTPRDRELVLVSHIPLHIESRDTLRQMFKTDVPSPGRLVGNAADVMALFAGRPLRAVLQGHLHFQEHAVKDGVPHIIGGAVCAKYWRGSWFNTEEGFGLLDLDGERHRWQYVDMGWEAKRP